MPERGPDGNALPKYPKVGPAHKSRRAQGPCFVCGEPATRICDARHGWEASSVLVYQLCGEHGGRDLRWKLVQDRRARRRKRKESVADDHESEGERQAKDMFGGDRWGL